jgi:hypothetical protein
MKEVLLMCVVFLRKVLFNLKIYYIMQKTINGVFLKKTILLIIMSGLALFLGLAGIASANTTSTGEDSEDISVTTTSETEVSDVTDSEEIVAKKAAMKAQIEALRAQIEQQKANFKAKQEVIKEERKEAVSEWKGTQAEARAEFMASLEGLSVEEKKVAILEYITKLKVAVEAKKTEMEASKDKLKEAIQERKDVRIQDHEAFRASLEGKTPQEKYEAIMGRLATLKDTLATRLAEEEADDVEVEDEADEEADDTVEDEIDEEVDDTEEGEEDEE